MKLVGKMADEGFHAFDAEPRKHAGHSIPRIWVMVADSKKAHIYRKTLKGLESIAEAKADGVEAIAARDKKEKGYIHDDMNFIHGLGGWLDQAVREDSFDRIVIVAAPRTLGDLRGVLSKPVHTRVMAEVSKELTKMNLKKLENELEQIVWF